MLIDVDRSLAPLALYNVINIIHYQKIFAIRSTPVKMRDVSNQRVKDIH